MRSSTAKEILKNVKKTYSKIAEDFSRTRQKDWEEFENFLPFIKNTDKLADIGCGNSRFYSFLSKKLQPNKIEYIGIDNNKKLLKEANKNLKGLRAKTKNNLNFKLKKGDILKLPLKDKSFDAVSCIAVLHHIPSDKLREKAIEELARILKEKGRLFLTVWNLISQPKYKKQIGKYEKQGMLIPWGDKKIPRYYYAFRKTELEKLLAKKFKIVKKSAGRNLNYICEKL
jgi:ubiquinone/menaquinone biosynthesis C-methylase UbiE